MPGYAQILLPIFTAVLGFLLSEYSTMKRAEREWGVRWDREKRELYSAYLAAADEYHEAVRRVNALEEQIDDPEQTLRLVYGGEIDQMSADKLNSKLMNLQTVLRQETEPARHRRDEARQGLGRVASRLEILSDRMVWIYKIGLEIHAGEDAYNDTRKAYLDRVRQDLKIPFN